jgi:TrmH family RNA methyltransferase
MPPIAARNPEMQTLRRLLRRRSARSEAGRYVIEGPRLVIEALDAGVAVEAVYVPAGAADAEGDGGDLAALAARCRDAGLRPRAVAAGVIEQVATTQAPQPALAIAVTVRHELGDLLVAPEPLVVVLCDVTDPGNAGTLVRVAEAAGAAGVVVCGRGAVDMTNPKVVRAAAGSSFRLPVVVDVEPADVLAALRAAGLRCVATAMSGRDDYDRVDLRGRVALVLGNEAHGLGDDVISAVDAVVRIPMRGVVESLNVATAGAVVAFEAARQRREPPNGL